ncbi:MAG TPA: diaminopimelate decarboxylase [Geminicoccaceae bacterium]|nr:diaminopimelate decarboxylase [Geminicoccus sp.]HMU50203.1 diaminopimelate decarboxylase [Geminicoccaceae bacterium]
MIGYRDGRLTVEGVDVADLAARVGTPFYVYGANGMRDRLRSLFDAFAGLPLRVFFAAKANSNLAVLRTLHAAGAGIEVVSGGEIRRALAAGVPGPSIVFAGVAKQDDEIRLALEIGLAQLNVESVPELERISALAVEVGRVAPIALRINPDVAAATHDKIATGRKSDKFGIAYTAAPEVYALARRLPGVEPVGLHMHIGSQITDVSSFEAAYLRGVELFRGQRAAGVPLRRLDLGGGFGVRYSDEERLPPDELARLVRRVTEGLDAEIWLEPGRFLVAESGLLVASVVYVKDTDDRRFLIVDAGMHTLLRPAMYGAHHTVIPVSRAEDGGVSRTVDIVGPICESSDVLARGRSLPELGSGDLVAFATAGAYGAVMGSNYNSFPSAAEVLVEGKRWAVVKPRREPEQQFADEVVPEWLEPVPAS